MTVPPKILPPFIRFLGKELKSSTVVSARASARWFWLWRPYQITVYEADPNYWLQYQVRFPDVDRVKTDFHIFRVGDLQQVSESLHFLQQHCPAATIEDPDPELHAEARGRRVTAAIVSVGLLTLYCWMFKAVNDR